VTPKGTAFIIWAVIFLTQAVYCILQLVPRFRGKAMVQNGVGYYYIATCIFQVSWTLAFAYEVFWLSQIFIVLIWGSLVALLYSQYFVESEGTLLEFWLLRFPFAIHCGWLTAATALNANVLFVEQDSPADIQLAVAIISLAVLHAISVWVLFGIRKANYTIAGVLSWANGWIYAELQSPRDSIVALFSTDAISGVSYAAVAVAFIILAQIVARVIIDLIKKCRGGKGREDVESTVSSKALLSSESEA
jgi:benzodiazapine receptor